jgi:hypothetical protein
VRPPDQAGEKDKGGRKLARQHQKKVQVSVTVP